MAAPAPGATGFGALAKKTYKSATKALGLAKTANERSKDAINRADEALDYAESIEEGTQGAEGAGWSRGPQGPAGSCRR